MRLELSARAEREIHELYLHGVSAYGFRQADEYIRQLRQRIGQLAEMPFTGAPRSDIRPGIRLLVFKAHNILYKVTSDSVLIVRILHRSANWVKLL